MTTASEADPDAVLEPTPPEVKLYQRQKLQAVVLSLFLKLLLLAAAAFVVGPAVGQIVPGWERANRWYRLVAVAVFYGVGMEILTLPLACWSGFVLEHRYHLSNQRFGQWLWRRAKGYLIGGPLGLFLLLGLYFLLWQTGRGWWLWAAAGYLLVSLVLGQLVPVVILPLFYKVTRLEDKSLVDRLRALADGTGLTVQGVYRWHLSAETRKANAALTGLGRTRRVLLGDTLLDNFSPEEIEVVFAHEVGHHVHRHLMKMVVWSVALTGVGFFLVDCVLRSQAERLGYAGFTDPAALPLLLLVLTLFGLLMMPLDNALSRFFERQCDRYALDRTRKPAAYRSAFVKLARMNKADPDPNPLVAMLFHDHPPIRKRLSMADGVVEV